VMLAALRFAALSFAAHAPRLPPAAALRTAPPHMMASAFPVFRAPVSKVRQMFKPGFTVVSPPEATSARVGDHMTRAANLVTLTSDMSLKAAACMLSEERVSGAPVVDDGLLVGILSQKDLLYSAAGRNRVRLTTTGPRSERHVINEQRMRKVLDGDVGSVMSTRLKTVRPDSSVREAAKLLLDLGISRVPVTNEHFQLVGLLSTSDIMDVVTKGELCLSEGEAAEECELGCAVFGA